MSNNVRDELDVGCLNTDKELFRETEGDFYSPSCFMTKERMLGINVGGYVYVKPLRSWVDLIAREKKMLEEIEKPLKEYDNIFSDKYGQARKTFDAVIATINKYKGE